MTRRKIDKGMRPPTIPFIDEGGRRCLRVPLDPQGSAHAVVLERDYLAVQKVGATGTWRLNANSRGTPYVRTHIPDDKGGFTAVLVARLIARAGSGTTIYYVNKDRLDLRPENLFWGRDRRSKRDAVKVAERGARYRADRQRQQREEEAQRGAAA